MFNICIDCCTIMYFLYLKYKYLFDYNNWIAAIVTLLYVYKVYFINDFIIIEVLKF